MRKIMMVLAVGLFVVAGASLAMAEDGRFAKLEKIAGDVQVRTAGASEWVLGTEGMVLHENDEIQTGAGATAELSLDKKGKTGTLKLRENSRMKLNTLGTGSSSKEKITYLDLALGKVLVMAGKMEGDSKFEVRTPSAISGVRGTIFEVAVESEKK